MIELITASFLPIVIAFLLGLATGWWAWARYGAHAVKDEFADNYFRSAAVATPAKVATPAAVPVPAAPIAAAAAAVAPSAAAATPVLVPTPIAGGSPRPNIAPAVGAPDDLQRIRGIGPKLSAVCHSLGVSRFDQIAAWTPADVAEVDHHLHDFHGRIARDNWVEQAKLLVEGDLATLDADYGAKERQVHYPTAG